MVTVWTPQAIAELRKAYDYISKDSPQNARKVVDELTRIADQWLPNLKCSRPTNSRKIMTVPGGRLKNCTTAFHI